MTVPSVTGRLAVVDGGMTHITEYEQWLRAQSLSQSTIHQRTRFAARRFESWGTWDLTPDALAAYLDRYSGWTRATYHGHLTSIYAWQLDRGHIAHDPMRRVRVRSRPRPRPRPLSAAELTRVLDTTDDRLLAFLELGALAGLRAHEIAKMHGRDIEETSLEVLGKGQQWAAIPTHPLLWDRAQRMPRNGYWFPSPARDRLHISASLVSGTVAAHFRACGVAHGSIHRLRATYGTSLMHNGESLPVIQGLMRHASLSATAHYLGVNDEDRRAAINRLAA